ncbi:MAG: MAPEG family protein [Pseudomonadota bacterium]
MTIILPIALTTAAGAALINLWLGWRVGKVRIAEKISIGDGGNPRLIARMRAQLNFAEYVPVVLILIGLIEAAMGTQLWLWVVSGVFLLGRVLHGFGMDGGRLARGLGIYSTMLIMLGLAGYAVTIPYLTQSPPVRTMMLR